MALAKKQRLSRSEFANYFKTGKRYHYKELTIVHTPLPEFHSSVVVGKKVEKSAVKRNQLRRRVYGVLQTTQKKLQLSGVYLIILKSPFVILTRKEQIELIKKSIGQMNKST